MRTTRSGPSAADSVPAGFDTAFLDWFRERTEAYWAALPRRTPQEILAGFVKREVGGAEWLPGTRWSGGLDEAEIALIEGRWDLRFPTQFRLFLQRLGAPEPGILRACFVDRRNSGRGGGWLPLDVRRRFGAGKPVVPDAARGELARARYGRRQDMVLIEEPSFYDWSGDPAAIEALLDWVADGLEFDVECNDLWPPSWGPKPVTPAERTSRLRELIAAAPRLIPVYGHRCLVGESSVAASPVLSIWQSDIIVYGADFRDYLLSDFVDLLGLGEEIEAELRDEGGERIRAAEPVHHTIPFWGELLAINSANDV